MCVDGVFELSSWRAFQRTFYFVNIPSTDSKSTFRYPSFSGTAIRDFGSNTIKTDRRLRILKEE